MTNLTKLRDLVMEYFDNANSSAGGPIVGYVAPGEGRSLDVSDLIKMAELVYAKTRTSTLTELKEVLDSNPSRDDLERFIDSSLVHAQYS